MYFRCRIQQVLISLEIHNWNNCFLLLFAYKRRSWLLKRPPWSIQIKMIPIVLTLNNMGWSSGKPVKILKKWLDYLLLGMFIDKVKKFCDHSMILWEMVGDLLSFTSVVLAPFFLFLVKYLLGQMMLVLKLTIKDYNTPNETCFGGLFQHHKNPSILWQS